LTRKSLGNVIFRRWRGLNIIQERLLVYKVEPTPKRLAQQDAMRILVYIYRRAKPAIDIGLSQFTPPKDAYSWFLSLNLSAATDRSSPPSASLIPASLKVSDGIIGTTPITVINFSVGSPVVNVYWNGAAAPSNSNPADQICTVIWNSSKNEWNYDVSGGGSQRSTGSVTSPVTSIPSPADVIHVWLFFQNSAHTEFSDSVYAFQIA